MSAEAARDWQVFDGPALQESLRTGQGKAHEVLVALDGVHCGGCVSRVERLVAAQGGEARVDLATRSARLRYRPPQLVLSRLLASLDEAGYAPRVLAREDAAEKDLRARRLGLARIGVAVIASMQVMMLAWPAYVHEVPDPDLAELLRWAQALIAVPSVLWAGAPFFRNSWAALRARTLNMDVPVALSLLVACVASSLRVVIGQGDLYFDAATMFVAFLLIGRQLEGLTRARAAQRQRLLAGRRALTAQRRTESGLETVAIEQLRINDQLLVAPGEALPADGVLEADAELDESLLSGESRPQFRAAGAPALAGSLNLGRSALSLRATAVGEFTQLAAITRMLHGAQAGKPRAQQLADRVAGHFTAAVLVLAAIGAAWAARDGVDAALNVALAVMVASCPCALSLAVPVVLASASSRLAAAGVLVARPDRLLRLPEVDTVLLDKTGTLTRPEYRIVRVEPLGDLDETACLDLAASLEAGSRHPLAQAFASVPSLRRAESVNEVPGQGVSGTIDGLAYRLCPDNSGEEHTVVRLEGPAGPLARFVLLAPLREDAQAFVESLHALGLREELLSGDGEGAVASIASQLRIERHASRQTPEQKLAHLRRLQGEGRVVLAVGDGINDAPFLAAADVSVALPQGAALTQSRADLILVGERLMGIVATLELARLARRRVRENLAWAVLYNLSMLPLAMSGYLPPWLAALGMSVSSLFVAGNALRLGTGGTR